MRTCGNGNKEQEFDGKLLLEYLLLLSYAILFHIVSHGFVENEYSCNKCEIGL
jgi:hypothetical protein